MLSVMLCVYNGEELIKTAIDSVINQPCRDLELIIMNDGSTDSTTEICEGYAEADERVKLYTHPNVGLGKNRNLGFELLNGRWTIFLDHDDMLAPGFFTEKFCEFLRLCEDNSIEVIIPYRIRMNYEAQSAVKELVPDLGVVEGKNNSWGVAHEFSTLLYRTELLQVNQIRFHAQRIEMESIFRHKAVYFAKKCLYTNKFFFAVRRDNPVSLSHVWNICESLQVRFTAYKELREWHEKIDEPGSDALVGCDIRIYNLIDEFITESIKNGIDCRSQLKENGMAQFINDTSPYIGKKLGIKLKMYMCCPSLVKCMINLRSSTKEKEVTGDERRPLNDYFDDLAGFEDEIIKYCV